MARRVGGEGSVILTRSPFTNWNRNSRLHWCNFMAVFFSFVAVLSLLCCGFCGAETEFSILEEAQVLAVQMKKLSSQELGVFTMQEQHEFVPERDALRIEFRHQVEDNVGSLTREKE